MFPSIICDVNFFDRSKPDYCFDCISVIWMGDSLTIECIFVIYLLVNGQIGANLRIFDMRYFFYTVDPLRMFSDEIWDIGVTYDSKCIDAIEHVELGPVELDHLPKFHISMLIRIRWITPINCILKKKNIFLSEFFLMQAGQTDLIEMMNIIICGALALHVTTTKRSYASANQHNNRWTQ